VVWLILWNRLEENCWKHIPRSCKSSSRQVGRVLIYVTKHSIGLACHLPMHSERWWKKGELSADLYKQFLLPEHHDLDWSQGILSKWLKEEWRDILTLVQRYMIGEGQISYAYHFMHLNGDIETSLPFYLLKCLTKMSKRVQNRPQTSRKILFFQGLMKMLDLYALREVQMTWR